MTSTASHSRATDWDVAALMADGSRRALYDFVRRQDHPVGREEAADATGISRGLAAFHLDKLAAAGLLAARYEAPVGQPRSRGRTPKVYEAVGDGLSVTIPERRYELVATILADAVAGCPAQAHDEAMDVAWRRGHDLGATMRASGAGLMVALADLGFEPHAAADGRVLLHNCPFHAVASRQTTLVCGLNLRFVTGLVDGLDAGVVQARLASHPRFCCVELTPDTTLAEPH
jgi:predicted ArsR family transcriptional regulator